ncbi:MAG: DUF3387 domain-containing protein [Paludibacteraceae bacterium]|nr:DUF3387 domain-containing protein [Paludibacteraceae bacterium]
MLVVDYIGIKNNMNKALKRYATGEMDTDSVETIEQSVAMVKDELDILRRMFATFDYSKFTTGTPLEQLDVLNRGAEFAQATKDVENTFMGHTKKLKAAFGLCCNSEQISFEEREDIHYFCGVRAIIYKLTKGNLPDAAQMNRRVSRMIEEAILSEHVEEIVRAGSDTANLDVMSEEYMERLAKLRLPNTKVKLMERLLKTVMFKDLGITYEEKAFYDILKSIARQFAFAYPEEKLLTLAAEIKRIVDDKSKYTDWAARDDIKAELKMDLILVLAEYGYPPVTNDEVFKEIFEQAENFKKYND